MKKFISKIIIIMMLLSIGYYLRGMVSDNNEVFDKIHMYSETK